MINLKSVFRMVSVMILAFSSVFICSIFFNFNIDLRSIEPLLETERQLSIYDAQIVQGKVIVALAGGVLGAVAAVVLLFSIAQFINENSADLGVLKALGYSEKSLALGFLKFGLAVLAAAALGYAVGSAVSPVFYKSLFNADGDLPDVTFHLHIETPLALVALPAAVFSLAAALYAMLRLKRPPLSLINGVSKTKVGRLSKKLLSKPGGGRPFLKELRQNMLFSSIALIFFVWFAAFGFAAQMQMAFTMRQVSDGALMTGIFIAFGLIMGLVTLLLSLTFIVNKNGKYIAMLKGYGYTPEECGRALFGGYRLVTYIGFAIGSVYQFILVKLMAELFGAAYELPKVRFSFLGFFVTLGLFIAAYEFIMLLYKKRISDISLRKIMQA